MPNFTLFASYYFGSSLPVCSVLRVILYRASLSVVTVNEVAVDVDD